MLRKLTGATAVGMLLLASKGLFGQDVFTDVFREAADEVRLRHDYRHLQRDLATGNTAAAQYDLMRIQQDRFNLARDQMQLNYDLNRPVNMSPYSNYPGYYGPSTAGQMTYFPPLQQPVLPPAFPPAMPPTNVVPLATSAVPINPVPRATQTVKILNPAATGVTLGFVFGSKSYSIDAGQSEDFLVAAPTVIAFNRGGTAGTARFTLAGGNTYEFQSDDTGWVLVRKQLDPSIKATDPVPPNPLPSLLPLPSAVPTPDPSSLPAPGSVVP